MRARTIIRAKLAEVDAEFGGGTALSEFVRGAVLAVLLAADVVGALVLAGVAS